MVAPEDPVPDFLKTNLDPSAYLKIYPWFFETLPSTGSVYEKFVEVFPAPSFSKTSN